MLDIFWLRVADAGAHAARVADTLRGRTFCSSIFRCDLPGAVGGLFLRLEGCANDCVWLVRTGRLFARRKRFEQRIGRALTTYARRQMAASALPGSFPSTCVAIVVLRCKAEPWRIHSISSPKVHGSRPEVESYS